MGSFSPLTELPVLFQQIAERLVSAGPADADHSTGKTLPHADALVTEVVYVGAVGLEKDTGCLWILSGLDRELFDSEVPAELLNCDGEAQTETAFKDVCPSF